MTRDEQFRALLRLYTASIEHNIALRGKLTISQPISTGVEENIKEDLEEAEEALIWHNEDVTLKRICKILFAGEFKDQYGFLITPAADRNLLRAIGIIKAAKAGLPSAERNKLLAIFGRVHDQLQDVRNILKGKGYE